TVTDSSRRLDRKRVLSIRPLKIGTPSSRHLAITSLRSSPDSRASSVGVRWLGIYLLLLCRQQYVTRKYALLPGRSQGLSRPRHRRFGPLSNVACVAYWTHRGVAQPGSAHRSGR